MSFPPQKKVKPATLAVNSVHNTFRVFSQCLVRIPAAITFEPERVSGRKALVFPDKLHHAPDMPEQKKRVLSSFQLYPARLQPGVLWQVFLKFQSLSNF